MNRARCHTESFCYLRDPLFLTCVALYFVNRLVIKRLVPDGFVHDHFNDLICIPFWVPIMLWLQKSVGLRPVPAIPATSEVFIPLVVWSLVFELWLPTTRTFAGYSTGDYRDILWYAIGAMLAACWWSWWYRAHSEETEVHQQKTTKDAKKVPQGCGVANTTSTTSREAATRRSRGRQPTGQAPIRVESP